MNLLRNIKNLYKYGFRFFLDKEYRKKVFAKEYSKRRRQKIGNGFLSRMRKTKYKLAKRHGYICRWCFKRFSFDELTVDHIQRVKDGGSNDIDNLRLLCVDCPGQ